MAKRIYLFPGQGSQKKGMGSDLFQLFPSQTASASAILGYSISELCLGDPKNQLDQTQFTQPALYVIDTLAFLKRLLETGEMPHIVAGHSLGEYAALFAARVFDFETGLKLVQKRAELMGQARGGGMAAVIGLRIKQIEDVLAGANLRGIDIANLNSPLQTVISGDETELTTAQPLLERAGAQLYKRLPVSAAFHSRYMRNASDAFKHFIAPFELRPPCVPVYSNVTASRHSPDGIKDLLVKQIVSPVRWTETMQALTRESDADFFELGPGNVLTGLLRRFRTETV